MRGSDYENVIFASACRPPGVFKMSLLFWKTTSKIPFAGLIHIKAGRLWPGSFSNGDWTPRIHA